VAGREASQVDMRLVRSTSGATLARWSRGDEGSLESVLVVVAIVLLWVVMLRMRGWTARGAEELQRAERGHQFNSGFALP
jgi:hypothetical protein